MTWWVVKDEQGAALRQAPMFAAAAAACAGSLLTASGHATTVECLFFRHLGYAC